MCLQTVEREAEQMPESGIFYKLVRKRCDGRYSPELLCCGDVCPAGIGAGWGGTVHAWKSLDDAIRDWETSYRKTAKRGRTVLKCIVIVEVLMRGPIAEGQGGLHGWRARPGETRPAVIYKDMIILREVPR